MDGDHEFPALSSCLSPYVHQLIIQHTHSIHRNSSVLNDAGLIDFDYICSELPENGSDSCDYFTECIKIVAPMIHSIEDRMGEMGEMTADTFFTTYNQFLNWTGNAKILEETWRPMFVSDPPDPVDQLTVLLVTTAVLERALGDIYMLKGPAPCPFMLKDLLVTRQLQDLLGSDVLTVLRLIIGPPSSLNLRNVAWHGFPTPGEIPTRCIWFVMMLVPSIGHVLQGKHITQVKNRETVTFPCVHSISEVSVLSNEDWLDVVCNTDIVPWKTCDFWRSVKKMYLDHRYGVCCALLLYYLEQGLRKVFATANNCEHRILTAQATELFTTFDEMLSPFLPDNTDNKIQTVIGDDIVEVLLDHLSYQNGPRVRDRLSHGEASWDMFPWQLADNMATIAVSLSARSISNKCGKSCDTILKINTDICDYNVQFHRISIIKAKMSEYFECASQMDGVVKVLPDLSPRTEGVEFPLSKEHDLLESQTYSLTVTITQNWSSEHMNKDKQLKCYKQIGDLQLLMMAVLSTKIHTLYRGAKISPSTLSSSDTEGEILSLLHHILEECTTVLTNIQQFIHMRQQLLHQKQLRSRQRDNFIKFLTSFPSYVVVTSLCSFMCCWQLYHLDQLQGLSPGDIKLTIKFWKSTLQFCENLHTCSQADKNKWTDGLDLIRQFIKFIQSNIHSHLLHVHQVNTKE